MGFLAALAYDVGPYRGYIRLGLFGSAILLHLVNAVTMSNFAAALGDDPKKTGSNALGVGLFSLATFVEMLRKANRLDKQPSNTDTD